jgi:hypothetical protein
MPPMSGDHGTPHDAAAAEAELAARLTAQVGTELHRLVPAVHAASRPHGAPVLAPVRPYGGTLVDIRTLLLHGAAPLPAVRAIHRYQPGLDEALEALASGGWLVVDGDAVLATHRCRALPIVAHGGARPDVRDAVGHAVRPAGHRGHAGRDS